jgi:hypothetical protein
MSTHNTAPSDFSRLLNGRTRTATLTELSLIYKGLGFLGLGKVSWLERFRKIWKFEVL